MTTSTITDYARDHSLAPADLLAIINTDTDQPATTPARIARRVELSDGVYLDAAEYPVEYLDDIAESIR